MRGGGGEKERKRKGGKAGRAKDSLMIQHMPNSAKIPSPAEVGVLLVVVSEE